MLRAALGRHQRSQSADQHVAPASATSLAPGRMRSQSASSHRRRSERRAVSASPRAPRSSRASEHAWSGALAQQAERVDSLDVPPPSLGTGEKDAISPADAAAHAGVVVVTRSIDTRDAARRMLGPAQHHNKVLRWQQHGTRWYMGVLGDWPAVLLLDTSRTAALALVPTTWHPRIVVEISPGARSATLTTHIRVGSAATDRVKPQLLAMSSSLVDWLSNVIQADASVLVSPEGAGIHGGRHGTASAAVLAHVCVTTSSPDALATAPGYATALLSASMADQMLRRFNLAEDTDAEPCLSDTGVQTRKPAERSVSRRQGSSTPATAAASAVDDDGDDGGDDAASRIRVGVPPLQKLPLAGRDHEMDQLQRRLEESGSVAVTGCPGIGKTSLVRQYVQQHADKYSIILWVDAATSARKESVGAAAAALGIKRVCCDRCLAERLQEKDPSVSWLLVCDNVHSAATATALMPRRSAVSQRNRHAILISGRSRIWPQRLALTPLAAADAESVAVAMQPDQRLSRAQVIELVRQAKCVPGRIRTLLRMAHVLPDTVSARVAVSQGQHRERINRGYVLEMIEEALEDAPQRFSDTLVLTSFLARRHIPLQDFLWRLYPGGKGTYAAAFLLHQGLLKQHHDGKGVSVNRHVHAVLRSDREHRQRFSELGARHAFERVWSVVYVFDAMDSSSHAMMEAMLPHVESVLQFCVEVPPKFSLPGHLLGSLGEWYCDVKRDYATARPYLVDSVNWLRTAVGAQSPDYGVALNRLARCYMKMRHLSLALELHRAEREIAAQVDGVVSPGHAVSLHNIGLCLRQSGENEAALATFQRVLEIYDELGERGSEDYIAEQTEIAATYRELQHYGRAVDMYRRVAAHHAATQGKDSKAYAYILNDIAVTLTAAGENDEALRLFDQALSKLRACGGPEHTKYAHAQSNMAACLTAMGRARDAVPLLYHSLAVLKRRVPPGHRYLLRAQKRLADAEAQC